MVKACNCLLVFFSLLLVEDIAQARKLLRLPTKWQHGISRFLQGGTDEPTEAPEVESQAPTPVEISPTTANPAGGPTAQAPEPTTANPAGSPTAQAPVPTIAPITSSPTTPEETSAPVPSVCGDNVKQGSEDCDGTDFGGATCASIKFDSGTLGCTNDCKYDTSGCRRGDCGDNVINNPNEDCDGNDFGGFDCLTIGGGFHGGNLKCLDSTCIHDTSECTKCGDNVINGGDEKCDGEDLGEMTCIGVGEGFTGGTLSCNDVCEFDTSLCSKCGNNLVDSGEECDGDDLNGATCISQGFAGGDLACASNCRFRTVNCIPPVCGDGIVNGAFDNGLGEECDRNDFAGKTCQNLEGNNFVGGSLKCLDSCRLDISECISEDDNNSNDNDSSGGGGGGACFSGNTRVTVLGKGLVSMKDLEVNDEVQVQSDGSGNPVYQRVYSFGHYSHCHPIKYIQLFYAGMEEKEPLEISSAHLIYTANSIIPIRADEVRQGDTLVYVQGTSQQYVTVRKIKSILREGAYLPLTPGGTIVVNGVLASTYVSIQHNAPTIVAHFLGSLSQQSLFHWWLSPYRMVCMRLSTKLCENDYDENGIIHWLNFGQWIAEYGEKQNKFVQILGTGLVFLSLAAVNAIEALFFYHFGLMWLVAGLSIIFMHSRSLLKRLGKQKRP